MLPLVLAAVGAAVTVYGVAANLAEPALKAYRRELKSKEDAARFLIEALDYEAAHGKIKDTVRKLPVKPDGKTSAYYQIKTGKQLSFIVIYSNGDIAMKSAEKDSWDWYKSPDSLNRLYAYFRTNFNSAVRSIEGAHLEAEDFGPAVTSATKLPGTFGKLKN